MINYTNEIFGVQGLVISGVDYISPTVITSPQYNGTGNVIDHNLREATFSVSGPVQVILSGGSNQSWLIYASLGVHNVSYVKTSWNPYNCYMRLTGTTVIQSWQGQIPTIAAGDIQDPTTCTKMFVYTTVTTGDRLSLYSEMTEESDLGYCVLNSDNTYIIAQRILRT